MRLGTWGIGPLDIVQLDCRQYPRCYILQYVMETYGIRDYHQGPDHIPKAIREHLGLNPGDRVKFFVHPDGSVILLPKRSASAIRGMIKSRRRGLVTTEQMTLAAGKGATGRNPRRPQR